MGNSGSLRIGRAMTLRRRGSLSIVRVQGLFVRDGIRAGYSSDGKVNTVTMRRWADDDPLPDSVPSELDLSQTATIHDDDVVWGGFLDGHYGHFLLESVARLWPLLPGGELEGLSVVFANSPQQSFIKDWLLAFGAKVVTLRRDELAYFRNVYVPDPAVRLRQWLSPEIRDIHMQMRASLRIPHAVAEQRNAWLSRGELPRGMGANDEALLEWILAPYMQIVRPEKLSLAEQVQIIEVSDAIMGVIGSAFHSTLMALEPPVSVYVCPPRIVATYPAQEELMRSNAVFVQALTALSGRKSEEARMPGGQRLLIPELLRVIREELIPDLFDHPMVAALAFPERHLIRVGRPSKEGIESLVARVILDPPNIGARLELGARLEEEQPEVALEQFLTTAELADDHTYGLVRAARLLWRLGRRLDASTVAQRALGRNPSLGEVGGYLSE